MTDAPESRPQTPKKLKRTPPLSPAARAQSRLPLGAWVGLGAGAAVALLSVLFFVMVTISQDSPPPAVASESDSPRSRKRTRAPSVAEADLRSKNQKAREALPAKQQAENPPTHQKPKPPHPKPKAQIAAKPKTQPIKPAETWNRDILAKNDTLTLPERTQSIGPTLNKPVEIAKIFVPDPKAIDLKIHSAGEEGFIVKLAHADSDTRKPLRRWIVQRKEVDPFTKQDRFGDVGTFELADQRLIFAWNMSAPEWTRPRSLKYGLLEISKDGESEFCRLSAPQVVPDAKLANEDTGIWGTDQEIPLALEAQAALDPKSLRLDVELVGPAQEKLFAKQGLKIGDTATFPYELPDPLPKNLPKAAQVAGGQAKAKDHRAPVDFEIAFQFDRDQPLLVLGAYAERNFVANLKPAQANNAHTVPLQPSRRPVNTASLKKLARDAEGIKRLLTRSPTFVRASRELAVLQKNLALLQARLKVTQNLLEKAKFEQEIRVLELGISKIQPVAAGYQRHLLAAEENIAWAKEIETHFAELEKTGRIAYQIYTEIKGRKIYLVQSQSARQASPDNPASEP